MSGNRREGDSPSYAENVGDSPSYAENVGDSPSYAENVGGSPTLLLRSVAISSDWLLIR